MQYDYLLTIKKERRNAINLVSIFVLLLSVLAFLSLMAKPGTKAYLLLLAAVLIIAGLILNWIRYKNAKQTRFGYLLFLAGAGWLIMPAIPWIGLPVMILSFLESPAKKPLTVGFTKEWVVIHNLFGKKIGWEAFNNVMLKDGILTLDFKNNKIFQKVIVEEEQLTDETTFNKYCALQISSNANQVQQ